MSCRPLLRALSRSPSLSRSIVVDPLQVIAVFLALMGFMVVKNKGKAKAFVKSFMSFEGPAGLLVAPFKAHFPSAECALSCAGIIVLELCLEIWVRIGAAIVVYSCLVMLTSVVICIRTLWATLSSCWE